MKTTYHLKDYIVDVPQQLIAQVPAVPRDSSRLLLLNRQKDLIEERIFRQLPDLLEEGDVLVFNNTKVITSTPFIKYLLMINIFYFAL